MALRVRRCGGFTLVELLVALFVMALMAVLSWRGLDGMVRAQEQTQARSDEVQALQVGLAQWHADLDALVQLPQINALDWNGRVLRLTRRSPVADSEGVVVVGWSGRGGRWSRWQSPPLTTRGQVEDAWARADAWAQGQAGAQGAGDVSVTGLSQWQVFFYRADAWTNPLSSDASQAPPAGSGGIASRPLPGARASAQLPEGVRAVLTLAPGQALSGELTVDWVRPDAAGRKS